MLFHRGVPGLIPVYVCVSVTNSGSAMNFAMSFGTKSKVHFSQIIAISVYAHGDLIRARLIQEVAEKLAIII